MADQELELTTVYRHIPVLLDEVLEQLDVKPGDVVVDCTLGGAGHTVEMAKRIQPDGISIGIDQDPMALEAAQARVSREVPEADFIVCEGNFGDMDRLLVDAEIAGVDAFLFDLGVSSPQLDIPERGFSYHEDAPLDMRMDTRTNYLTAAEVIETYNEADLTRILRVYGDEKFAKHIAKAIVRRRAEAPIATTLELVDVITSAIPAAARRGKHPARKTFQALRIEVNHELEVLERGLKAAIRWANPGARIAVISYHSLEDRIVKHVFAQHTKGCTCPPDLPVCVCGNEPSIRVLTKRPIVAGEEELEHNPRARSALMRVCQKL